VLGLLAGKESVTALCGRFGVSRQTAYKFRRRFLDVGRRGLADRTRGRTRKFPDRWPRYRRWLVARRRRYPTRGASKLRWALRRAFPYQRLPSLRTVERWLQVAGLSRAPRRRRRITAQRLQAYRRGRRSNEVWTIDLKGWCRTGDHAKIEPLTIRDLGSRFILWNQPLPRHNDESVRRVCRRLFRRHGCPKAIRADLGAPFCSIGPYRLTSLSLWWYRLNIGVEFVFRRGGIDNNAHEQMHAVLEAATACPPARTRGAQLHRLRRWTHYYNYERPHDGIGGCTPAQRYRSAPAALPALLQARYRSHWLRRKVNQRGAIRLEGRPHHVGVAFAGLDVGCQPTTRGFNVYYHRLPLTSIGSLSAPPSLAQS
jgi:putative transposase